VAQSVSEGQHANTPPPSFLLKFKGRMNQSHYKLARSITCSVVLSCAVLAWFPFVARAYVLPSTRTETAFSSIASLGATPVEPVATSPERQVRSLCKDGRRSNVIGLITACSTFAIANDHHRWPLESKLIRLSAAHFSPNDRGPPAFS
jgi:hypothetical protein